MKITKASCHGLSWMLFLACGKFLDYWGWQGNEQCLLIMPITGQFNVYLSNVGWPSNLYINCPFCIDSNFYQAYLCSQIASWQAFWHVLIHLSLFHSPKPSSEFFKGAPVVQSVSVRYLYRILQGPVMWAFAPSLFSFSLPFLRHHLLLGTKGEWKTHRISISLWKALEKGHWTQFLGQPLKFCKWSGVGRWTGEVDWGGGQGPQSLLGASW